jgi:hypothetical protein
VSPKLTLEEWEERFPWIEWREPVRVTSPLGSGLACRACIAELGLSGGEIPDLPQTRLAWEQHMEEIHGA